MEIHHFYVNCNFYWTSQNSHFVPRAVLRISYQSWLRGFIRIVKTQYHDTQYTSHKFWKTIIYTLDYFYYHKEERKQSFRKKTHSTIFKNWIGIYFHSHHLKLTECLQRNTKNCFFSLSWYLKTRKLFSEKTNMQKKLIELGEPTDDHPLDHRINQSKKRPLLYFCC